MNVIVGFNLGEVEREGGTVNEDFILQLIEPYLNSKREISEFEFMELFASGEFALTKAEQYNVITILIENDIEFVDEKDRESELLDAVHIMHFDFINQDTRYLQRLSNEQLCLMAKNDDTAALAALCEKNQRFLYQKAIKVQGQYSGCSLTVDDLAQEGVLGIIEAVKRFDPSKEFLFLTYAWSWIRQMMGRAILNTGFMVRLPVHVFERISRLNKYRQFEPSANIDRLIQLAAEDGVAFTAGQIAELINYSQNYINISSLNTLVGEKADTELMELLLDTNQTPLEDIAIEPLFQEEIKSILATLNPKESEILMLRFGFEGSPMTLDQIGSMFNVTRERVRQIEAKALRRIRRTHGRKLRYYV